METTGKEENIKITQKYVSSLLSGKDYKDENFPVSSFLIDKKLKKITRVFYFYARTADDIADHASIKKDIITGLSYWTTANFLQILSVDL